MIDLVFKIFHKLFFSTLILLCVMSAPESKVSGVRCPSLTFNIFDFSSETAGRTSKKYDRKQDLNLFYQVFIRPSSDGTYYGMVMSVRVSIRVSVRPSIRPSVRPSVRLSVRPVSVCPFSALFSYML